MAIPQEYFSLVNVCLFVYKLITCLFRTNLSTRCARQPLACIGNTNTIVLMGIACKLNVVISGGWYITQVEGLFQAVQK